MPSTQVNYEALAADLTSRIMGDVRFDAGHRALYATDASNYRQVPIGVVLPKNKADILTTIDVCRKFNVPILSRGGGTSLAGQCCNVAVVMDMSKYFNHVLEVDVEAKQARIEPGTVLDTLRDAAAPYGLMFGPDPATHNHCTLGGMIGNNACGAHAMMNGPTIDNVVRLKVLTYDGVELTLGPTNDADYDRMMAQGGRASDIYQRLRHFRDKYAEEIRRRFPKLKRRVSGYSIDQLLPENDFNLARAVVGSEGTLIAILEATVQLIDKPKKKSLMVLGFPDVFEAADRVPTVLPFHPISLEGMDETLVQDIRTQLGSEVALAELPPGAGWLLVEFGGDSKEESDGKAWAMLKALQHQGIYLTHKLIDDEGEEKHIWKIRESGLGATAFLPGKADTWEGWEDSAVPPEHLGAYLRDLKALYDKYEYFGAYYGHFGGGCVHTRINFDLTSAAGIRKYRSFVSEAGDAVVKYGGSFSGEHGDGQSKAFLLPKLFGPELVRAFEEFKAIWDPLNRMNPGKLVHAYDATENLRLGAAYQPPDPETHFKFPMDRFTFNRAALRCVGIGECRKEHEGTMCPSYMVTREEMHSTRGRTHLLFEMLKGEVITGGWKDPHVKEALDLCLSCKGCRGECPVKVDIPTMKSEFLAHYYKGRLHPLIHYAFGGVHWAAKAASWAPGLVNFFTQSAFWSAIGKKFFGVAPERKIPAFAEKTFRDLYAARKKSSVLKRERVLLWVDTFTNYFHPQNGIAALEILEDAGYEVIIPSMTLCCGRPLYDYGMLNKAKELLLEILEKLRSQIRDGIMVVGLEPSCVSVFRDEMINLFPHDEDAQRLKTQTFMLSEFLEFKARRYSPPRLQGKVLLHGHCHQKAILHADTEASYLKRMGLQVEEPETGCCGMAGGFGFEKDHYEVSVACGERVLLPAVRKTMSNTWVVTSGFSCHEQILQQTGRHALHFAEIIAEAIRRRNSAITLSKEAPMAYAK